MKWYVLIEQTHNDLGWIHPVKRTRDVSTVELPGTIKYERTAYEWTTKPGKSETLTCKSFYEKYGKWGRGADADYQFGWDEGMFFGTPYWSDKKCKAYHPTGHTITLKPRHVVPKGWRITRVTQDKRVASTWTLGQAR